MFGNSHFRERKVFLSKLRIGCFQGIYIINGFGLCLPKSTAEQARSHV